jgi:AraC family transcriptional regulator, regulatory protein of adaptative response / methylated-DNA-[protein]-cysteine methyltransferase
MDTRFEEKLVLMDEDVLWELFLKRDPNSDGLFIVGVLTTGIFCRPTCPARRPRRENVRFYVDIESAAVDGLRPCKRCRPDEQAFEAQVVEQTCRYIADHLEEVLTLNTLAEAVHVSPAHLHRVFKRTLGVTPRAWIAQRRAERFANLIEQGSSVIDAQHAAGYGSSSRIYSQEGGVPGMTPRSYQRKGEGLLIRYTLADSPLGRLLVASTDRGVCQVALGDEDRALIGALFTRFPAAEFIPGDSTLDRQVNTVLAYLAGRQPSLDLPVDLQVTAFQRQVYDALRQIPAGEIRTYSQVAEAIGRPQAVRAVANACAANPTALIVPCHRVVRSDGTLGGYRWGLERKRALLALEQHLPVYDDRPFLSRPANHEHLLVTMDAHRAADGYPARPRLPAVQVVAKDGVHADASKT